MRYKIDLPKNGIFPIQEPKIFYNLKIENIQQDIQKMRSPSANQLHPINQTTNSQTTYHTSPLHGQATECLCQFIEEKLLLYKWPAYVSEDMILNCRECHVNSSANWRSIGCRTHVMRWTLALAAPSPGHIIPEETILANKCPTKQGPWVSLSLYISL